MANIPKAQVVCTVSVQFVQTEEGELATVLIEEGIRPFEADIILEQAARQIQSHIDAKRAVREHGARHRRSHLRSGARQLH